ncbi:toll/interleukin-1 receptor domain-containing protein [Methylomagnum sp.]
MTTFDVFLSHNSKDKPAVRDLKAALEAYGLKIWYDEDELRPGVPWQELLESGIRDSASVAVVIGKDGLGPWEDEEMRAALDLAVKDKRPVIPVLLPDVPAVPSLPLFLSNRTWVDLRPALSAKNVGRLVWGITGIRPSRPHPVTAPAYPPPPTPSPAKVSPALAVWRERLDFLLLEEAKASRLWPFHAVAAS